MDVIPCICKNFDQSCSPATTSDYSDIRTLFGNIKRFKKSVNAKTFNNFDDAVTAPLFGYKNAKDYYTHCSSKQFLKDINIPTLLINALDDSFLSASCHPFQEAENNKKLFFEASKYGGHVGFNSSLFEKNTCWSENRVLQFINYNIS